MPYLNILLDQISFVEYSKCALILFCSIFFILFKMNVQGPVVMEVLLEALTVKDFVSKALDLTLLHTCVL